MSKYAPLWACVSGADTFPLKLSFDDIRAILGFPLDHSFLTYKKEANDLGITVTKIAMKDKYVVFDKS